MGKYIMSFDAGTTSNRCILFLKKGKSFLQLKRSLDKVTLNRVGWNRILKDLVFPNKLCRRSSQRQRDLS